MTSPGPLPEIDEATLATSRYLAALGELTAEQAAGASALPGWTRAHVIAHLSRNADAFTRVLRQVAAGEPASMYDSAAARDDEITETVGSCDVGALVVDAHDSSARLAEAAAACGAEHLLVGYTRLPASPGAGSFVVAGIAQRRRTEIEIHRADLMTGYSADAWPEDFSRTMIRSRAEEITSAGGPPMALSATDIDGRWEVGRGPGPEVRGTAGALAWWLVGRGGGGGLVSSTGELPRVPRWR